MKNQNLTPVCVYKDTAYMEKTARDLETARFAMQELLNEWLKLEIGDCTDLNELLMRPEIPYKKAIDRLVEVPATNGQRFNTKKAALLESLDLPDPTELYRVAKAVRKIAYCAVPELFQTDGEAVILNKEESDVYLESQNVYIADPEKVKIAEDMQKLADLYKSLNQRTNGKLLQSDPHTNGHFRGKFIVSQKTTNSLYELFPDPGFLRGLRFL